jgi:hypothetical protein
MITTLLKESAHLKGRYRSNDVGDEPFYLNQRLECILVDKQICKEYDLFIK